MKCFSSRLFNVSYQIELRSRECTEASIDQIKKTINKNRWLCRWINDGNIVVCSKNENDNENWLIGLAN